MSGKQSTNEKKRRDEDEKNEDISMIPVVCGLVLMAVGVASLWAARKLYQQYCRAKMAQPQEEASTPPRLRREDLNRLDVEEIQRLLASAQGSEQSGRDAAAGYDWVHQCFCPITQCLMCDPVTTADGHTYEREAIALWLRSSGTSPFTNLPLPNRSLRPNTAVKRMIDNQVVNVLIRS